MALFTRLSVLLLVLCVATRPSYGSVDEDFDKFGKSWLSYLHQPQADGSYKIGLNSEGGAYLTSKERYFHGSISASLKLPCGFSAGVVSSFYLKSDGPELTKTHDEIDMEFLGGVTPEDIVLHTNYFAQGHGHHEQQFKLWFNPCTSYHNYTFLWNWDRVVWLVDGIPLRQLERSTFGRKFLQKGYVYQPMFLHFTMWDGSSWATDHGNIKADFSLAPFQMQIGNVDFSNSCEWKRPFLPCAKSYSNSWDTSLSASKIAEMNDYKSKYMIYNYETYQG
eukprot:jgi/Mesen1/10369/ME000080S09753